MYTLTTPLSQVVGVGPTWLSYFKQRQLTTVADLLLNLPLRYEDLSLTCQIKDLANQIDSTAKVSLTAQVESVARMRGKRGLRARLRDESGVITAVWFHSRFMINSLKVGSSYVFSGVFNPQYQTLTQPVFEPTDRLVKLHTGRLVPVYTSTLKVKQGSLRRLLHSILTNLAPSPVTSYLDPALTDWREVLTCLHFPSTADLTIGARHQLAHEELLSLSLRAKQLQNDWLSTRSIGQIKLRPQDYWSELPFKLTGSQKKVLHQIADDLGQTHPMNRLLLGDVGSGKTVVAIIAGVATIKQGHPVCLVAPTRILAEQHLATLQTIFPHIPAELVSSTAQFSPKRLSRLRQAFVVATHAVLPHLTKINPGLVIFDEQQRFGVAQRSPWPTLNTGEKQPHVLTMTATPIPRSLMLTVFSHLQLSVLDEMPAGRLPTKTWLVPEVKRVGAWRWIENYLTQNPTSLCLVVCPFIDPSATASLENVKAVTQESKRLKQLLPDHVKLALLHARLTKKQQQDVIDQLNQQKIQVLVATPMVEVGVDLPTADIMVIEAAERFGLSSLHQLRGRVGRRGQQGYCLVFHSADQNDKRLAQFCRLTAGQDIAELDLKTRGAGDLFGVDQSGFAALRFASWSNISLIEKVQQTLPQLPSGWSSPLFSDRPLDKKVNPN